MHFQGKSVKSSFEHLQHHGQFLGNSEKIILLTEKNAQRESCELFHWGLTENYSLGDRQLWGTAPKRWGEGQYICDFGEEGTCSQTHILVEGCR